MSFLAEVAKRLGVADADQNESDVLAALDEALAEQADGVLLTTDQWADLAAAVDKAPDDPIADVIEALIARATGTEDKDNAVVDRETLAELRALADDGLKLRMRDRTDEAENVIDEAVAAGKVNASLRAKWVHRFVVDKERTTAALERIPAGTIPRMEIGYGIGFDDLEDDKTPTGWVR